MKFPRPSVAPTAAAHNGSRCEPSRQNVIFVKDRAGLVRLHHNWFSREITMKFGVVAMAAAMSAFGASAAHAQWADLNGQYRCVENCLGPGYAFITQQGWDMNMVNEAGIPTRAWVDYPGHIWAENWREGAFFSPDGLTVQFDNGSVWHRIIPAPQPVQRARY
jgi:hypothetical protein